MMRTACSTLRHVDNDASLQHNDVDDDDTTCLLHNNNNVSHPHLAISTTTIDDSDSPPQPIPPMFVLSPRPAPSM